VKRVIVRYNGLEGEGVVEIEDDAPSEGEIIFLIRGRIGSDYRVVKSFLEEDQDIIELEHVPAEEAIPVIRMDGPITALSS
jgi:hypothetical protein